VKDAPDDWTHAKFTKRWQLERRKRLQRGLLDGLRQIIAPRQRSIAFYGVNINISGVIRGDPMPAQELVMSQKINLNVNGAGHAVEVEPDSMLLYALRNNLGLRGPKFGCGLAQCGACTVLMDGNAIRSCVTPVSAVGNAKVVTLEGLGTPEQPHPLQRAFIAEQAAQCGYCINGMIMAAKAFLDQNPHPSRDEIKQALNDNLCRCGTHMRIVRAVQRAAGSTQQ